VVCARININTIKRQEAVIDAGNVVGLAVNAEKTKYMLMSVGGGGQNRKGKR
jgi:hypothetical protein